MLRKWESKKSNKRPWYGNTHGCKWNWRALRGIILFRFPNRRMITVVENSRRNARKRRARVGRNRWRRWCRQRTNIRCLRLTVLVTGAKNVSGQRVPNTSHSLSSSYRKKRGEISCFFLLFAFQLACHNCRYDVLGLRSLLFNRLLLKPIKSRLNQLLHTRAPLQKNKKKNK